MPTGWESGLIYGFKAKIGKDNAFEVRNDGTFKPVSLADSVASNNSIYYSTDQSKLVYKDASGTVNDLY